MAKTVGDVLVEVGADVTPLVREMRRGGREVSTFGGKAGQVAASVAKSSAAMAAAMTAAATAVTAMAVEASGAAKELANLSTLAGVAPSEFQKMAAAADTVGISGEKLGDIFKDMRDRIGDFMTTGAGPMVDFFETVAPKIGVTAEQFARLSGPEALQLFVSSMEQAGLSANEMVFHMEALAGDATALLPLLRDGGKEFRRLGDDAQAAGRVLSDDVVQAGADLDRKFTEIGDTLRTSLRSAILENADDFSALADGINESIIPALSDAIGVVAEFVAKVIGLGVAVANTLAAANDGAPSRGRNIARGGGGAAPGEDQGPALPPGMIFQPDRTNRRGDVVSGGLVADPDYVAPEAAPEEDQGPPVAPSTWTPPGLGGDGSGGGSSRGASGAPGELTQADLDRLEDNLATEAELLSDSYETKLAMLQDFRDKGMLTEEEYNDLEQRLASEHGDAMAALDRDQLNARLQLAQGFAADLAGAMEAGGKKTFKITKALSAAQAAVAGAEAAVHAWDKGMAIGGLPLAGAWAAASVAKTAGLLAQINSQRLSSSSSAGGGSGGAAATSAAASSGSSSGAGSGSRGQAVLNIAMGNGRASREEIIQLAEEMQRLQDDGFDLVVRR